MKRLKCLLHHSLVSIHAPREGCDYGKEFSPWVSSRFNSRTPGGVRHGETRSAEGLIPVSIHAPREGCDT